MRLKSSTTSPIIFTVVAIGLLVLVIDMMTISAITRRTSESSGAATAKAREVEVKSFGGLKAEYEYQYDQSRNYSTTTTKASEQPLALN